MLVQGGGEHDRAIDRSNRKKESNMPHRYFKASDGTFTVFRASASRVYRGAWMRVDRARQRNAEGVWAPVGEPFPVIMGFSAKLGGPSGMLAAIEITKAEHQALVAAKNARAVADPDACAPDSPRDSWVRNEALS
jgi:hypothetical protein